MGYKYDIELNQEKFDVLIKCKAKYNIETISELLKRIIDDYIHDEEVLADFSDDDEFLINPDL